MAKGRVIFNYEKCKGCMLCINVCPKKILEMDFSKINQKGYNLVKVVDSEKCIGCGFCGMICPDSVITVYRVAA